MRTKGIAILLSFLLIIGLTAFFWGNSFLSWALEQSLQAIIGAKVEIEDFKLNPIELSVRIGALKITNPADTWKNIIAAENIGFKLSAAPLFEGKTVIEEISVADLVFNAPRQSDGKLPQKKKEKKALPGPLGEAQAKLQQSIAQIPILKPETVAENLDIEKITASYQFKTDLSAARIKAEIGEYQGRLKADLEELEAAEVQLKNAAAKVDQINKLNSNNLLELKQQLDLVKEVQQTVKNIRARINDTNDRFKKDKQALETALKGLKTEAEADYRSLLELAKVPDLSSLNYAEALLGKELLNYSTMVLKMAEDLQKQLPVKTDKPPKEKPTRAGQNITFPGRKTYPRFLVQKIAVSGKGTPGSAAEGFYANGLVTGLTSEPPIYGSPTTAAFSARSADGAVLKIDGLINHLTPDFRDEFQLKLSKLPLSRIDFPDNHHLPAKMAAGGADIDAFLRLTPDTMTLEARITANDLQADFTGKKAPDDLIGEAIRNAIAGLNQITVNFSLEKSGEQLEMKIASNLNEAISAGLKRSVGAKITEFNQRLKAKVDAKLLAHQQTLEKAKLEYEGKLSAKLTEVQNALKREEQALEAKKKELEELVKNSLIKW